MASKKKGNKPGKIITINFSWIYFLLIPFVIWMLFRSTSGGANPQKIEWEEVKTMAREGDIEEITFIRNDYEGRVTLRPDRGDKYVSRFGGKFPEKSPHFIFLVSGSFNAEEMFGELNDSLPQQQQFKVVIEKNDRTWMDILNWVIWPVMLIVFWVFMFRGMNKGMAGPGGPGGIFNVGKATGKLADKEKSKVTFKDVAGLYGAKEEVM